MITNDHLESMIRVYAVAEKKAFMPSMVVECDMDEWLGRSSGGFSLLHLLGNSHLRCDVQQITGRSKGPFFNRRSRDLLLACSPG